MSKSVFPRTSSEETPTRLRRATVPVPLWVLVILGIILLGVVLFALLGHGMGGHGMGNMQMSIPVSGRDAL